jgi:hypothetical protein
MRRVFLMAIVVALIAPAIAGTDEKFTVSGVGSYPISRSMISMWLAGPDRHPLLMVYFNGPDEWHNTKWKIASKFEKGKPGWAELQSEKVTLRLSLDVDSAEAGVQSGNFKVGENNTFLVLHTAEPSIAQKIIPLGVFDVPASTDQPASVLLLRGNPELMERINKVVASGQR